MIKLVPEWAYNYQEYWDTIKNRNLWFIQLRYAAFFMVVAMFSIAIFIFELSLNKVQIGWSIGISLSILFYNIILHASWTKVQCTPGKFNHLHYSLIQMILDLIALTLIVYFSGSIETPLYMLYIFHMIIGSLILPSRVIFVLSTSMILIFSAIVVFEFFSIIPHYHIKEIYSSENVHNVRFILSSLGIFAFTIYTAVGLTSRIAKRLYKRERQLKEMLEELNRAEEAKQKYIMAVVHEIKSPIVAAQSIVEIVKNGYLGEINDKMEVKLNRTINRTQEALRLINNILRISKLRLLGEITYEEINLYHLILDTIDKRKETIEKKEIQLKFEHGDYVVKKVAGDKVLFELIMSNVIGNAVKYTPQKGNIIITLEDSEDILIIDVTDSGIGIPEKEIKLIFTEFYRASNIAGKVVEGSGLGLALVKEIVERLNGTINIDSPSKIGEDKNPGTSVRILLPLKEQADQNKVKNEDN